MKLRHLPRSVYRACNRAVLRAKLRKVLAGCDSAETGSPTWLICREQRYGGLVTRVPRRKVSPLDPRSGEQVSRGGMRGGDRMFHHGYAPKYAEYLRPLAEGGGRVTLAEIGILKGTGLAVWCDLFPEGRIIGFDIDPEHARNNIPVMRERGAFASNEPELHEFDQFVDNTEYLRGLLDGDRIDVCIDDGFHSDESIMTAMASVMPHLADRFIYIIEDNAEVHRRIREAYPHLQVDNEGMLTVVTPAAR